MERRTVKLIVLHIIVAIIFLVIIDSISKSKVQIVRRDVLDDGRTPTEVYNEGYNDGYASAESHYDSQHFDSSEYYSDGYKDGYDDGYNEGKEIGYEWGISDGNPDSYHDGYDDGYIKILEIQFHHVIEWRRSFIQCFPPHIRILQHKSFR